MRVAVLCVSLLTMLPATGIGRQGLVGVQANWRDLQTWSRLIESSRENELGLGLQPQGAAMIAFLGRLSISNPRQAPREVRVHVAPASMANSTVMRTKTLTFVADAGTDKQTKIDASAGLIADDPTPGGIIENAMGPIRAADFIRLTQATTLQANILGFDVVFRPDQIRAMQTFAQRLYLAPSPPR
jgi:hypothetical protein